MHFLTTNTSYMTTVFFLPKNSFYFKQVNFHTFLGEQLDEINILSIKSCAKNHSRENYTIIIWTRHGNEYKSSYENEFKEFKNIQIKELEHNRDVINIRNEVLLHIGGCWFDPRYVFLKPLEPLLWTYGRYVCVFNKGTSIKDINDSFMISLVPQNNDFTSFLDNDSTNTLMLPSSWIDPLSVENPFTKINDYDIIYNKMIPVESYMIHCGTLAKHIEEKSLLGDIINKEA